MLSMKLNGMKYPINISTFPGGEEFVNIHEKHLPHQIFEVELTLNFNGSKDLVQLALVMNALRSLPIRHMNPYCVFKLNMPYIPYARQDRICKFGESSSLAWVASFINGLGFHEVTVVDPHSHVAESLINNVVVVPQEDIILDASQNPARVYMEQNLDLVLVAPDLGAVKKVSSIAKALNLDFTFALKNRTEGGVEATHLNNPELITGRPVLVVDDICDGGRTFTSLGKLILEHNPREISLFVTHGIFSAGLDVFRDIYKFVFAYNTVAWGRTEQLLNYNWSRHQ